MPSKTARIGASGYRGVTKNTRGRWQATVCFRGTQITVGTYDEKEDAARAYDKEALRLHGDDAILNFPEETK